MADQRVTKRPNPTKASRSGSGSARDQGKPRATATRTPTTRGPLSGAGSGRGRTAAPSRSASVGGNRAPKGLPPTKSLTKGARTALADAISQMRGRRGAAGSGPAWEKALKEMPKGTAATPKALYLWADKHGSHEGGTIRNALADVRREIEKSGQAPATKAAKDMTPKEKLAQRYERRFKVPADGHSADAMKKAIESGKQIEAVKPGAAKVSASAGSQAGRSMTAKLPTNPTAVLESVAKSPAAAAANKALTSAGAKAGGTAMARALAANVGKKLIMAVPFVGGVMAIHTVVSTIRASAAAASDLLKKPDGPGDKKAADAKNPSGIVKEHQRTITTKSGKQVVQTVHEHAVGQRK